MGTSAATATAQGSINIRTATDAAGPEASQANTDVSDSRRPAEAEDSALTHDEIAIRAYCCWHERGCPDGSPEVDWSRAENELQSEKAQLHERSAAAASEQGADSPV